MFSMGRKTNRRRRWVSLRGRPIDEGDGSRFTSDRSTKKMIREIVLRRWYEVVGSVFKLIYVTRFAQTLSFGAEPFFIVESTFSA